MKKLLIFIILLFGFFSLKAQDQIFLRNGKIINCKIDSLSSNKEKIFFTHKRNGSQFVEYNMISSYYCDNEVNKNLIGYKSFKVSKESSKESSKETSKETSKESNKKSNKDYNDYNDYIKENSSKTKLNSNSNLNSKLNSKLSSSYCLEKASTNLTIGFTFGIFTGIYGVFSKDIIKPEFKTIKYKILGQDIDLPIGKDSNESIRKVIGITLGTVALVELIIGSDQLRKAALYLDDNKKVILTPSKSNIGIEIRF